MTETVAAADETLGAPQPDSYGRGARILSIGIAATGIFTFAYFAVASHVLAAGPYGAISLLWAVLFVVISVIYRPVEQLLSRTIADRRARGLHAGHPLRVPLLVQATFAVTFLVVALALRGPIEDAFDSATLYWIFVGATLAYAASYFARGYLAGHQWFGLYGGLVLFESVSRFCFPVAVALGLASGQSAVAMGILAAPVASLLVVPWAFARHTSAAEPAIDERALTLRAGAGFALSVAAIQLAEQTLLNASVLTVSATASTALAGVVFNALLITRAPLQLFQSIQTSLLPHLSGLEATEGHDAFARAIRVTILSIVAFAGAVALGLLLIGPWAMDVVFGQGYRLWALRPGHHRDRHGLSSVRRHVQPGRAGARPRARRGVAVADRRGAVRRLDGPADRRRSARARGGRLRGRNRASVRDAGRAVSRVARRYTSHCEPMSTVRSRGSTK